MNTIPVRVPEFAVVETGTKCAAVYGTAENPCPCESNAVHLVRYDPSGDWIPQCSLHSPDRQ